MEAGSFIIEAPEKIANGEANGPTNEDDQKVPHLTLPLPGNFAEDLRRSEDANFLPAARAIDEAIDSHLDSGGSGEHDDVAFEELEEVSLRFVVSDLNDYAHHLGRRRGKDKSTESGFLKESNGDLARHRVEPRNALEVRRGHHSS